MKERQTGRGIKIETKKTKMNKEVDKECKNKKMKGLELRYRKKMNEVKEKER